MRSAYCLADQPHAAVSSRHRHPPAEGEMLIQLGAMSFLPPPSRVSQSQPTRGGTS